MGKKRTDSCPVCNSDETDVTWVHCDVCRHWFHASCVALTDENLNSVASYHCDSCAKSHGPLQLKRQLKRARAKIDYVALDLGETFAVDKSMHPHMPNFLAFEPEAQRSGSQFVDILESHELTSDYIKKTGLAKPVLVPDVDCDVVGMKLPADRKAITVAFVAEKAGEKRPVEVMDVLSQQSELPMWNLGQWKRYFHTRPAQRDRIRNVILLEVSDVETLREFVRPRIVRELDLVDRVWDGKDGQKRPKVTVYCLMSVAGSYTDFHIDYSGTPVYYTVCQGTKTFLMFPPTPQNLSLYTHWCKEEHQNYTWFAEYSKRINGKTIRPAGGFKVHLKEGDLFMIPSGWIHAVHTPDDAVIIGGNYLTLMDMPMHLAVYEIERETRVPQRYRFPLFNRVLWSTLAYYEREALRDELGARTEEVASKLVAHLEGHLKLMETNEAARGAVPPSLQGQDLAAFLRDVKRHLRLKDEDNGAAEEAQPVKVDARYEDVFKAEPNFTLTFPLVHLKTD